MLRDRCLHPMGIRIVAGAMAAFGLPAAAAISTLVLSPDGITLHDTLNRVNWLGDVNLAAGDRFGLPVCSGASIDRKTCINPSGSMSYQAAAAWVSAMNAANYLGHSNWQLPSTPATDSSCPFTGPNGNSFGFNCTGSAMGSLYYNALGFSAPNTAVPMPGNRVGPFSNFQPYLYWFQTNNSQTGSGYFTFSFASGTGLQINPGGQTVYDPVTKVTWLANANLAATNTLGLPTCKSQGSPNPCVNQDGAMNHDSVVLFMANMNSYNGSDYLGQSRWELPPIDSNCASYNCTEGNPMGELFYTQFGLSQGTPVVAIPNIAVGPFQNMQPYHYWSCQGATVQSF